MITSSVADDNRASVRTGDSKSKSAERLNSMRNLDYNCCHGHNNKPKAPVPLPPPKKPDDADAKELEKYR